MNEPAEASADRSGIHVPREVADAEGLPEELDANVVGAYHFPSPERRGTAARIYLIGAALVVVGAVLGLGDGLFVVAVGLVGLAVWHRVAAWPLEVDEQTALRRAVTDLPFPVGHASATVRFMGWRARPVWYVVVYDATEPPAMRALVRVDGVTGDHVGETWVEAIPASVGDA